MDENRSSIVVNFIVRAVIGLGVIFFTNEILASRGISVAVGLNGLSLLTSGTWIAGGLLTLRDSFLPKLVSISQKASNLKMHIDKRKRCRYNTTYKQNISK